MGRTNDNDPRVTFITIVPWILVSVTQLGSTIITGLLLELQKEFLPFPIEHNFDSSCQWDFSNLFLSQIASLPFVLSFRRDSIIN